MSGIVPSRRLLLLCAGLFLPACTTFRHQEAGVRTSSLAGSSSALGSSRRDVLTSALDVCTDCASAFDLVKRLRPGWLRSRGSTPTPDYPRVVVDDMPMGDLGELRGIPSTDVQEMRLLNAAEATWRYGPGFTAGAIVVRTRRH